MPQLNAEWYLPQIVWLFISLGLLYWLLRTKALPRVAEILDQRQRRMSTDLERAAAQRREAEEIMHRYEATIAEARDRAKALLAENQAKLQAEAMLAEQRARLERGEERTREILEHARAEAERQTARTQEELEASLRRRTEQAMDRIAREEARALHEVRAQAAELAIRGTRRLLAERLDEGRHRSIIDDAIAEVDRKLH